MSTYRATWPVILVTAGMLTPWPSGLPAQTFVAVPAVVSPNQSLPIPGVSAGSSGSAFVAWAGWIPTDEVKVARTSDWGMTWSAPALVNAAASVSTNARPGISADASGHVIVAWPGHLVQSYDDGQSWGPPEAISISFQPQVVTDGAGTWVIVWTSTDSLGGTIGFDYDVFLARSIDDGQSWATGHLNIDAPSDDLDDSVVRLATDGIGNWMAIWERTLTATSWSLLVARSTDNALSWSAPQVVTTVGASFQSYDIAAGGSRWHIVASLLFEIYLTRSDDIGLNWSPAQPLTNSPTEEDRNPAITTDGYGSWLVAWQSRGTGTWPYHLVACRSGDHGTNWSAPAPPNGSPSLPVGTNESPVITTDQAGNWMVAWTRSLSGPIMKDILFTRGVGPCPTSSLTLTPSNPTPTSYLIDLTAIGFTPGNQYFTCFTYEMGEHPAGPWFGIDPLYDELAIQAALLAPPFNGLFDAAGSSAFSWSWWGTPGPLGITLYAVTIEHVAGNILRASPPTAATL